MESKVPAYAVGTRLTIEWPLSDGSRRWFEARIDAITGGRRSRHGGDGAAPRSKRRRRASSPFKYLLCWRDGSAARWSRLLHLPHRVLQDPDGREAEARRTFLRPRSTDEEVDHAETPAAAYAHAAPFLDAVASRLGKRRSTLRIYDPYYCAGAAAAALCELGFLSVYNRPEDCYRTMLRGGGRGGGSGGAGDGARGSERGHAWDYEWDVLGAAFDDAVGARGGSLAFLGPARRYTYRSPAALRLGAASSKRRRYVAPFVTLWAMSDGGAGASTAGCFGRVRAPTGCVLARARAQLPAALRGADKASGAAARRARFNAFCREHGLGKLCAAWAAAAAAAGGHVRRGQGGCGCGARCVFEHPDAEQARAVVPLLARFFEQEHSGAGATQGVIIGKKEGG
eukprot:g2112.t1